MRKLLFILLLLFCVVAPAQNRVIDSLKHKLATTKEDTNRVKVLADLSAQYTWSYADTAVLYAQQALQLAEQLNYDYGKAKASTYLGRALTTLGNYPQALYYSFKALSLSEKQFGGLYSAFINSDIALCYRDLGDYQSAIRYGRKALQTVQQQAYSEEQLAYLQGDLASTYQKAGELDSAIKYGEAAYKVNKQWSGVLYPLASAYAKKGDYIKAKEYFQRAIPIAVAQHVQIDILDTYNGLASMYKQEGKQDSAINFATKAVQLQWARVYPAGVLQASNLLAGLYETTGKTDSALKYYKLTNILQDSLFNQEKTRAIQNLAFSEERKQQELAATQQQYKNRIRQNALAGSTFTLLVVAFVLYRNNRNKQKANKEIQNAYTELKATQAQLIQSEKMASLGELTAGIAHEIQNPLNFVNNFSETNTELIEEAQTELKSGNVDEAFLILNDVKENEHKIAYHGKRADAIVKSMMQHARSSTGEKQPTNLNVLIDEYLRLAYHGFRAKDKSFSANIQTNFDDRIGKVSIVPQEIGRVLLNLFNNAFYAVHEHLKKLGAGYEPLVRVRTKKGDEKVEITVQDNGTGIPQQTLDKIFQPFFTTKPTGEGTGLGLSLSYDIITKGHNGSINVESKEGEGSVFTIRLPISEHLKSN